jgi:hypothetical protein
MTEEIIPPAVFRSSTFHHHIDFAAFARAQQLAG